MPTSASFLVTEDCNLSCEYCFEKSGRKTFIMSKEILEKGIDLLFKNAKKTNSKRVNILLFGGEPLMQPKVIKQIFDYGLKLEELTDIKFTSDIITNGTLMNDEIFELFKKYKDKVRLSCQISVDGIKVAHDMYRVDANGNGSFDTIEKNLPRFKELYSNNPEFLTVHGVINKQSLPYLYESYKFFRDVWNMKNIWFMPLHEEDWSIEDVKSYDRQLGMMCDDIIADIIETGETKELDYLTPINKCFYKDRQKPTAPCGAGKTLITVTSNGEIYPCHNFYFNDPDKTMKIGDVWDGIDEEKRKPFLDYTSNDMSCPSSCTHKDCYRCIATNWTVNGNMLKQVRNNYCAMSKIDEKYINKMYEKLKELGMSTERNNKNNSNVNNNQKAYQNENEYIIDIFAKSFQLLLLKVDELNEKVDSLMAGGKHGNIKS